MAFYKNETSKKGSATTRKKSGRRNLSAKRTRYFEQEKSLVKNLRLSNAKRVYNNVTASQHESWEEYSLDGIEKYVKEYTHENRTGKNINNQPFILMATRNKINGMFHIESHTQRKGFTADEFDGYWGTCKLLQKHIEKFGEENFERIVLMKFDSMFACDAEEYRIKRKDNSYKDDKLAYNSQAPSDRIYKNRCDDSYKTFDRFTRKLWNGKVSYKVSDEVKKSFHMGSVIEINVAGRNLKVVVGDHVIGKDAKFIASILKANGSFDEGNIYQLTLIYNADRASFYITSGKVNKDLENSNFRKVCQNDKRLRRELSTNHFVSFHNFKTFSVEDYDKFLELIASLRLQGYMDRHISIFDKDFSAQYKYKLNDFIFLGKVLELNFSEGCDFLDFMQETVASKNSLRKAQRGEQHIQ